MNSSPLLMFPVKYLQVPLNTLVDQHLINHDRFFLEPVRNEPQQRILFEYHKPVLIRYLHQATKALD